MEDLNVRKFTNPEDSNMKLMVVRGNPSNTRVLEKGFFEKSQGSDGGIWYYSDGVTKAKVFCYYDLPSVKDLTENRS